VLAIQYVGGSNRLNLSPEKYNPIISIYMVHISTATDLPVSGYGFSVKGMIDVSWAVPSGGTAEGTLLSWNPYVVRRHQHNDVAQPVDWAYKTQQVGINQGDQVRARGTYAILKSHGQPSSGLNTTGWPYGLYNTLLGSDWKDWSSQVIDVDDDLYRVVDKQTIRTRIRSTSNTLIDRVFGAARYGDTMTITALAAGSPSVLTVAPNHGLLINDIVTISGSAFAGLNGTHTVTAVPAANQITLAIDTTGAPAAPGGTVVLHNAYLIDDEEVDTIAISDAVRGESVSYMFFGFMRNVAMALKISSLKAVIEAAGSRRRRGR